MLHPRDPAAHLWAAESSLRELGTPSLEDALSYLALLAERKPEKLERAAVRWHGRLETGGDVPNACGVSSPGAGFAREGVTVGRRSVLRRLAATRCLPAGSLRAADGRLSSF